jgi:hypothetical protein
VLNRLYLLKVGNVFTFASQWFRSSGFTMPLRGKWIPSLSKQDVKKLEDEEDFPRIPTQILPVWIHWEEKQHFRRIPEDLIFTRQPAAPNKKQPAATTRSNASLVESEIDKDCAMLLERLPLQSTERDRLIVHSVNQYDVLMREGDLRENDTSEIRNIELNIIHHPYVRKSSIAWCANKLLNTKEEYLLADVEADRVKATVEHKSKSHASLYSVTFETYDGFSCVMGYTRWDRGKDGNRIQITHVWILIRTPNLSNKLRARACNLLLNVCRCRSVFPLGERQISSSDWLKRQNFLKNTVWSEMFSQPAATSSSVSQRRPAATCESSSGPCYIKTTWMPAPPDKGPKPLMLMAKEIPPPPMPAISESPKEKPQATTNSSLKSENLPITLSVPYSGDITSASGETTTNSSLKSENLPITLSVPYSGDIISASGETLLVENAEVFDMQNCGVLSESRRDSDCRRVQFDSSIDDVAQIASKLDLMSVAQTEIQEDQVSMCSNIDSRRNYAPISDLQDTQIPARGGTSFYAPSSDLQDTQIPASGGASFFDSSACFEAILTHVGATDDLASVAELSNYDDDEVARYNELLKRPQVRYGELRHLTRGSDSGDKRLPDNRTLDETRNATDKSKTEFIRAMAVKSGILASFPRDAIIRKELGPGATFLESMCVTPPAKKEKPAGRDFVGRVNHDAVILGKHICKLLQKIETGSVFVNHKNNNHVTFSRQYCLSFVFKDIEKTFNIQNKKSLNEDICTSFGTNSCLQINKLDEVSYGNVENEMFK